MRMSKAQTPVGKRGNSAGPRRNLRNLHTCAKLFCRHLAILRLEILYTDLTYTLPTRTPEIPAMPTVSISLTNYTLDPESSVRVSAACARRSLLSGFRALLLLRCSQVCEQLLESSLWRFPTLRGLFGGATSSRMLALGAYRRGAFVETAMLLLAFRVSQFWGVALVALVV